jgi:hypothetical protein
LVRLAAEQPHLRAKLVPVLRREARVTKEMIRLNYENLGDFGGTNRVLDSWLLEVKGPYEAMQALIPTLKKYGLRYDRQSRSWSLHAVQYAYTTRKNENLWNWARRNQKAGYPVIKKLVDEYNREAAKANKSPMADMTPQEQMKLINRHSRQLDRLKKAGIEIKFEFPNRYSVEEGRAWVLGNTYEFRGTMKKFGFRWGNGKYGKGWWIASSEFTAIVVKWAQAVIRELPEEPVLPEPEAVLTNMSKAELKRYLEPIAEEIWHQNEGYDGEYDVSDVFRDLFSRVPRMSPQEQQDFYERWR